MRYVDSSDLRVTDEWQNKADAAAVIVANAEPPERAEKIARHSEIWSELKLELGRLSTGKCWYCESKQIRSDRPIDHFRPKNRVAGCDHPGYWWLAFNSQNYRYSCTYCNSRRVDQNSGQAGGKSDHFPLRNEERRACQPDDPIDDEQPLLLDPTIQADTLHLWFNQDGRVVPTDSDEDSWLYERATCSIYLYNLNHADICEARLAVAIECKERVDQADQAYNDLATTAGVGANTRFSEALKQLTRHLQPGAEYSKAARCTLMGLRSSTRPWLDNLIVAV